MPRGETFKEFKEAQERKQSKGLREFFQRGKGVASTFKLYAKKRSLERKVLEKLTERISREDELKAKKVAKLLVDKALYRDEKSREVVDNSEKALEVAEKLAKTLDYSSGGKRLDLFAEVVEKGELEQAELTAELLGKVPLGVAESLIRENPHFSPSWIDKAFVEGVVEIWETLKKHLWHKEGLAKEALAAFLANISSSEELTGFLRPLFREIVRKDDSASVPNYPYKVLKEIAEILLHKERYSPALFSTLLEIATETVSSEEMTEALKAFQAFMKRTSLWKDVEGYWKPMFRTITSYLHREERSEAFSSLESTLQIGRDIPLPLVVETVEGAPEGSLPTALEVLQRLFHADPLETSKGKVPPIEVLRKGLEGGFGRGAMAHLLQLFPAPLLSKEALELLPEALSPLLEGEILSGDHGRTAHRILQIISAVEGLKAFENSLRGPLPHLSIKGAEWKERLQKGISGSWIPMLKAITEHPSDEVKTYALHLLPAIHYHTTPSEKAMEEGKRWVEVVEALVESDVKGLAKQTVHVVRELLRQSRGALSQKLNKEAVLQIAHALSSITQHVPKEVWDEAVDRFVSALSLLSEDEDVTAYIEKNWEPFFNSLVKEADRLPAKREKVYFFLGSFLVVKELLYPLKAKPKALTKEYGEALASALSYVLSAEAKIGSKIHLGSVTPTLASFLSHLPYGKGVAKEYVEKYWKPFFEGIIEGAYSGEMARDVIAASFQIAASIVNQAPARLLSKELGRNIAETVAEMFSRWGFRTAKAFTKALSKLLVKMPEGEDPIKYLQKWRAFFRKMATSPKAVESLSDALTYVKDDHLPTFLEYVNTLDLSHPSLPALIRSSANVEEVEEMLEKLPENISNKLQTAIELVAMKEALITPLYTRRVFEEEGKGGASLLTEIMEEPLYYRYPLVLAALEMFQKGEAPHSVEEVKEWLSQRYGMEDWKLAALVHGSARHLSKEEREAFRSIAKTIPSYMVPYLMGVVEKERIEGKKHWIELQRYSGVEEYLPAGWRKWEKGYFTLAALVVEEDLPKEMLGTETAQSLARALSQLSLIPLSEKGEENIYRALYLNLTFPAEVDVEVSEVERPLLSEHALLPFVGYHHTEEKIGHRLLPLWKKGYHGVYVGSYTTSKDYGSNTYVINLLSAMMLGIFLRPGVADEARDVHPKPNSKRYPFISYGPQGFATTYVGVISSLPLLAVYPSKEPFKTAKVLVEKTAEVLEKSRDEILEELRKHPNFATAKEIVELLTRHGVPLDVVGDIAYQIMKGPQALSQTLSSIVSGEGSDMEKVAAVMRAYHLYFDYELEGNLFHYRFPSTVWNERAEPIEEIKPLKVSDRFGALYKKLKREGLSYQELVELDTELWKAVKSLVREHVPEKHYSTFFDKENLSEVGRAIRETYEEWVRARGKNGWILTGSAGTGMISYKSDLESINVNSKDVPDFLVGTSEALFDPEAMAKGTPIKHPYGISEALEARFLYTDEKGKKKAVELKKKVFENIKENAQHYLNIRLKDYISRGFLTRSLRTSFQSLSYIGVDRIKHKLHRFVSITPKLAFLHRIQREPELWEDVIRKIEEAPDESLFDAVNVKSYGGLTFNGRVEEIYNLLSGLRSVSKVVWEPLTGDKGKEGLLPFLVTMKDYEKLLALNEFVDEAVEVLRRILPDPLVMEEEKALSVSS